jgi:hypothetical protein
LRRGRHFKKYKHSQNKSGVSKDVVATARVPLGEKCVNGTQTYAKFDEIGQNLQSLPNFSSIQYPVEEV